MEEIGRIREEERLEGKAKKGRGEQRRIAERMEDIRRKGEEESLEGKGRQRKEGKNRGVLQKEWKRLEE